MRALALAALLCRLLTALGSDVAATQAASYWRGGRVIAAEEPLRRAPEITINRTIDYHDDSEAKECFLFYIEKLLEEPQRLRLLERELQVAAATGTPPSAAKPQRGVVAFLLMENADRTIHQDLLLALCCMNRFFSRYPVAIFHTNATTQEELARLRTAATPGLELIFEEVHLGFPASLEREPGGPDGFLSPPRCVMDGKHWWSTHSSCGCRCPAWRPQCWPLNWMHATRFFTAGMFRTRTFKEGNFDYFLRLDTDIFFVKEPDVDPISLMAEHRCAMVYDRISREAPGCHDGFDQRTMDFLMWRGYHGLPDEEILHVGQGPAAVGGQWTAGDARLFTSRSYLDFADFAASGIYSDRWADQLFLLRGVALFGPRAAESVVPLDTEGVSVCMNSLFAGGVEAGFVHKKGGFRDPDLLQQCRAQAVFG